MMLLLSLRCTTLLLVALEGIISFPGCFSQESQHPSLFGSGSKVTWASLIKSQKGVSVPSPFVGRTDEARFVPANDRLDQSKIRRALRRGRYSNSPRFRRRNFNSYFSNQPRYPKGLSINSQDPSKRFQKRALDFIYHKILEPSIHKHAEPRPSLIEELISTVETHVRKDLATWNQVTQKSLSKPPASEVLDDMEVQSSDTHHDYADPYYKRETPISSVAKIEPGENDDTFIVTDDTGLKHIVTVDEIINSLSQMKDGEIADLLLGKSEARVDIDRMDSSIFHEFRDASAEYFPPPISEDIQYSRKGMQDDDIILIKSKDGDTRLVTVRDLKYAEKNKSKQFNKISKLIPVEPHFVKSGNQNSQVLGKISPSLVTMGDLIKFQNIKNSMSHKTRDVEDNEYSLATNQHRPDQLNSQQNVKIIPKENKTSDGLEDIRQSLLEIRQRQQIQNSLPSPPLPILTTVSAPNSPPLKVINTDAPLMEFLPFQNKVSIGTHSPPVNQKSGIRNRLSNFFSRLVGKPVSDVNITPEPEDQFVQIVMPRADSNIMEQITIPLPKPIHFRGKRKLQSGGDKVNIKVDRSQRRSDGVSTTSSKALPKGSKILPKKDMKIGTSTAELIIQTANIPDSVRQKLLHQINDKPEFILPNMESNFNSGPDGQIDRKFLIKKNKAKKKEIEFPTGYTYEIPNPYDAYHQPHHYPPSPHHDHKDKGKKKYDDKQPLIDVNLLADLVLLAKLGDDNESFSFPKIGDASKFVDVRNKHYR